MTEKNLSISHQDLVSNREKDKILPRKLPQYLAGLSATLGALAVGFVIGWSSPAGDNGSELEYSFKMDSNEFSWVSSMFTLGCAVACIPMGMLCDLMGRRRSMLMTTLPFTIGWACVIWPNSVGTLIFGRFLLGLSGGAFCVGVPIYTGEIADKETRGRLGSYLELHFALGVSLAYFLGLLHNMFLLSLISASVPLTFFAIFYFMPETPVYHLMKGNVKAARETLIWLRGSHYDVEPELEEHKNAIDELNNNKISFFAAISSRVAIKGLFIGYGLMFFQQLSGINVIIFYGSTIFAESSGQNSDWPMIGVGALEVVSVLLSTLVVDKWGRKILLFVSGGIMCVTCFALGVYFYLKFIEYQSIDDLTWLPLLSICGFVLAIEFGFGPIPWMMMGEIFSAQVKGVAGSSACTLNWFMAFIVTKFYDDLKTAIGSHGAFWIFSGICGLSVVFVHFVVPETKGKTLEEIQIELSGSKQKHKPKSKA